MDPSHCGENRQAEAAEVLNFRLSRDRFTGRWRFLNVVQENYIDSVQDTC